MFPQFFGISGIFSPKCQPPRKSGRSKLIRFRVRIDVFIAPIIILITPLIKELTVFIDDFIVPKNPSTTFSAPFHAFSQSPVNIPVTKSIKPSKLFQTFPIKSIIFPTTSIIVMEIFFISSEILSINPSISHFTNGFKSSQIIDIT